VGILTSWNALEMATTCQWVKPARGDCRVTLLVTRHTTAWPAQTSLLRFHSAVKSAQFLHVRLLEKIGPLRFFGGAFLAE
jgi:hypothetical protein